MLSLINDEVVKPEYERWVELPYLNSIAGTGACANITCRLLGGEMVEPSPFEWLWRLIDRVRYGKPARREVVTEYTTGPWSIHDGEQKGKQ